MTKTQRLRHLLQSFAIVCGSQKCQQVSFGFTAFAACLAIQHAHAAASSKAVGVSSLRFKRPLPCAEMTADTCRLM